jgi:hypothetical protein
MICTFDVEVHYDSALPTCTLGLLSYYCIYLLAAPNFTLTVSIQWRLQSYKCFSSVTAPSFKLHIVISTSILQVQYGFCTYHVNLLYSLTNYYNKFSGGSIFSCQIQIFCFMKWQLNSGGSLMHRIL